METTKTFWQFVFATFMNKVMFVCAHLITVIAMLISLNGFIFKNSVVGFVFFIFSVLFIIGFYYSLKQNYQTHLKDQKK